MLFYPVDTSMGVVGSIEVSIGQKILHFRSIVQVKYVYLTFTSSFNDFIIFFITIKHLIVIFTAKEK